MPLRTVSEGLRNFLWQEMQNDSNATVRSAQVHLQELCDEAGDQGAPDQHWLQEIDELMAQHEEHTPIADLFSAQGRR